jgi:type VI secretion system protein ImpA
LHLGKDKLKSLEVKSIQEPQDNERVDDDASIAENTNRNDAVINSRESAINKLQEIAQFFRKTEPHSPMSYTIEQVIRWSELSLPELLNELITDSDARTGYFKLSGIKVSETETE